MLKFRMRDADIFVPKDKILSIEQSKLLGPDYSDLVLSLGKKREIWAISGSPEENVAIYDNGK